VIIAFIGSVFSPDYFTAQRSGAADPYEHCAVNVALYGAGTGGWAFTHYGRRAVSFEPCELVLAGNHFVWTPQNFTCRIREQGAPWPASLRGVVTLQTAAHSPMRIPLTPDGRHVWQALIPCGRVAVEFDRPSLRWEGNGYLDSNYGSVPIHQGFRRWSWLRAHGRDSTRIVYDVVPRDTPASSYALKYAAGRWQELAGPVRNAAAQASGWHVARAIAADPGTQPQVIKTLENAPFYVRSLVRTTLEDEPLTAMHESLSLERFQSVWVRSLLPFRIRRSRL
jgi:carotenoid 1,2-hydratase